MPEIESVKSVEKALKLLNCFSLETPELGISELSRKLKVSKSTAHRLVKSLEKEGFLIQDELSQQYRLGASILNLSKIILKNIDLRNIAAPIMKELRDKTEETVGLSIIFNNRRICIKKADSLHGLCRFIKVGQELPLFSGASGKLLLAYQNDLFIQNFLRKTDYLPDKIDLERIIRELSIIRDNGFCISSGELIADVTSISAPIWNHNSKVVACINVSGPSFRFTAEKTEKFLKLVLKAAADISSKMGYTR